MIDIFDLYERFRGRVNTSQGGHVKPHRTFVGWVKDVSAELFLANYKAFEKSNNISDAISPFHRSVNVVITGQPGQPWDLILRPKDYWRYASIKIYRRGQQSCGKPGLDTVDCYGRPTDCPYFLDEDEIAALQDQLDSKLSEVTVDKIDLGRWGAMAGRISKGPTVDSPKCTLFDAGVKIMPKRLGVVVFDYFRQPQEPVFAYTIINQGTEDEQIQYNKGGSTPLDWDSSMIPEFLTRLEVLYGTYTRNPLLMQQGAADKGAIQ